MADPFLKKNANEPISFPHELWNAWIDAALYVKQRQSIEADAKGSGRSSGIIRVQNTSGADRDQFDILGLDAPIITPTDNLEEFKQQVLLKGIAPATPTHEGKFCVLIEPLPNNEIGLAWAAGVAICKLDVTAESDTLAEVKNATYSELKTGGAGSAKILWKESGTGTGKWAFVRIGGGGSATSVHGKLDGALSFEGSATMSVWEWNGSNQVDSGDNVTVYDWLLTSGATISAGTKVTAFLDSRDDRYYVNGAQCS